MNAKTPWNNPEAWELIHEPGGKTQNTKEGMGSLHLLIRKQFKKVSLIIKEKPPGERQWTFQMPLLKSHNRLA